MTEQDTSGLCIPSVLIGLHIPHTVTCSNTRKEGRKKERKGRKERNKNWQPIVILQEALLYIFLLKQNSLYIGFFKPYTHSNKLLLPPLIYKRTQNYTMAISFPLSDVSFEDFTTFYWWSGGERQFF